MQRGAEEVVKLVGAVMLLVGLFMLLFVPPFGLLLLIGAGVVGILSVTWTRRRRHDETVAAVKEANASTQQPTAAPPAGNVTARLEELDALRDSGSISQDEYDQKRSEILGDL